MRPTGHLICTLFLVFWAMTCMAGRDAEIRGKSETGKVQLIIKTTDMEATVISAQLVLDNDTTDFLMGCDAYPVIDPANHLITLFLQQKGTSPGTANMKSLKIWAAPSSFVKMVEGPNSWRFKAKVTGSSVKEVANLDCVFMRLP